MNKAQFLVWLKTPANQRHSLVMGILNVTPNSFYDGGRYISPTIAYERAQAMIEQGVDLIDIGGESSKPGAETISLNEELGRVIPVIERICASNDVCVSIDTCKPVVMQAAIAAGAACINDISALTADAAAVSTAARLQVPICLMHMKGSPRDMQKTPHYERHVVDEINDFFKQRIAICVEAGIARDLLILDPGFGFGKSVEHNIQLTRQFHAFQQHQLPLLFGVSRKSTIGAILKQTPDDRLPGGLALAVFAVTQGASIIRTHDVAETKQALIMLDVIRKGLGE
ncbi:MAG: dihydropteroate synthase [Legionellaceae bacterium]|nr:dihydropteroate synthase [Legionellaceae bacterium]